MQNDSFTELRTELIGAEAGKRVAAALSKSRYQIYYSENREKKLAERRAYRASNREAEKVALAKWKANNRDKTREYVRAATIKSRYGVTRAQHRAMYEAQNHCCAICGIEQKKLTRKFCIDHDHVTGIVRGLVCHPCNIILGNAKDSVDVLRSAISYLEKIRT